MFATQCLLVSLLVGLQVDSRLVVRSLNTTILPMTTPSTTPVPRDSVTGCTRVTVPFKRKNGWWCLWGFGPAGMPNSDNLPATYSSSEVVCEYGRDVKGVFSSLETEEEWDYLFKTAKRLDGKGIWLGIGLNNATGEYYWNDGHVANTTLPWQPVPIVPGGLPAWMVDKTAASAPNGYAVLVYPSGRNTTKFANNLYVNLAFCGHPGKQFN